jgi:hypothetical protein
MDGWNGRYLIQIQVGNGRRVLFWQDRWIEGKMVYDIAPLVLELVSTRNCNHRTVDDALDANRWMLDISKPLSPLAALQCVKLWISLAHIDREMDEEDKFTWPWTSNGQYSAASTYNLLLEGNITFPEVEVNWENDAPLKQKKLLGL